MHFLLKLLNQVLLRISSWSLYNLISSNLTDIMEEYYLKLVLIQALELILFWYCSMECVFFKLI